MLIDSCGCRRRAADVGSVTLRSNEGGSKQTCYYGVTSSTLSPFVETVPLVLAVSL